MCGKIKVLTSGVGWIWGLLALYKLVTSLNRANKTYTFFFTGEHLQICTYPSSSYFFFLTISKTISAHALKHILKQHMHKHNALNCNTSQASSILFIFPSKIALATASRIALYAAPQTRYWSIWLLSSL